MVNVTLYSSVIYSMYEINRILGKFDLALQYLMQYL